MIRSNSVPVRWQDMTKAALLPAVFLLLAAGSAFGAVQYAITDLGTVPGGTQSEAWSINNSGQVVGFSDGGQYNAFLYSGNGTLQGLDDFAWRGRISINDLGQIAGTGGRSGAQASFLSNGGGAMQDLGTLGGFNSYAEGINNSGQVVGWSWTSPDQVYGQVHAFIYNGSGPMQDLGTLGGANSGAYGINDSGQVVGGALITGNAAWHAFRTAANAAINPLTDDLGSLGGTGSYATGINSSGQVVGAAGAMITGNAASHAFRTAANAAINPLTDDLGTLGGSSEASGINDSGQVVGWAQTTGNSAYRAFVYSGSGPMQDLNNLIAPSSGWTLSNATAINEKGQIVGYGTNPAGQRRAFLLSPLSTITTTTGAPPNTLSNALKPVDPTVTPPSGNLKRWNGQSWQAVDEWSNNGIDPNQPTVVLAHGWKTADGGNKDYLAGGSLMSELAKDLRLQSSSANILAWDWQDQAVSKPGEPIPLLWDDVVAQGLQGAEASAKRGGTQQGKLLANELQNLHISNDKLQLIGHSNGGAVVGQAASVLAEGGQKVQRITTLDTPNLSLGQIPQAIILPQFKQWGWTSADAMRYVDPNSASEVEVYYSDGLTGRGAFGFGSPLVNSSAANIFNGRIYPGLPVLSQGQEFDHLRIVDWYHEVPSRAPEPGEFVAGLNWSILGSGADQWVAGDYTEQGFNSKVFGTSTLTQQTTQSLIERSVDTFEKGTTWFGQNAERFMRDVGNFAAKIFPGSDGYLWTDVSVPADAYFLTFDLKIETPDLGDFLTVTLGDELIFYKGLNAADSDFWTVDPIFIGDFAGQTDTLLFTLNHVGTGTPSLLLDNITFWAVPEPSTIVMGFTGVVCLLLLAWRRRKWAV